MMPCMLSCIRRQCHHTVCMSLGTPPSLLALLQEIQLWLYQLYCTHYMASSLTYSPKSVRKIMASSLKSDPLLITFEQISAEAIMRQDQPVWPGLSAPSSALSAPRNGPPPLAAPVGICSIALDDFTYFLRCSSLWREAPTQRRSETAEPRDPNPKLPLCSVPFASVATPLPKLLSLGSLLISHFPSASPLPHLCSPRLCLVYSIFIGWMCPYGQCQVAPSEPLRPQLQTDCQGCRGQEESNRKNNKVGPGEVMLRLATTQFDSVINKVKVKNYRGPGPTVVPPACKVVFFFPLWFLFIFLFCLQHQIIVAAESPKCRCLHSWNLGHGGRKTPLTSDYTQLHMF